MWGLKPLFLTVALLRLTASTQLDDSHENHIRWVNCSENVPSTLDRTGVDLANLPPELHCGQISVPMDYARPQGPNNTITLSLAMIRPRRPNGVLFVNTGGSDPNVVVAWEVALNQTTTFSGLSDYYDMMFMDIRGTYGSSSISLSLDAAAALPSTYPQNESDFNTYKKASAAFFQSWIDNSSPPGILQFVSTKEVVQDYEQIRKALGYSKIHFLGESYGTYRAQKYALAFPDRVGHFALDSGVPYGMTLFDKAQAQVSSGNRALLRADAYCQNDPSCPFHSEGTGSVPKAVHSIFTTPPCSEAVPLQHLQQAVLTMLENADFAGLLHGLKDALKGNCSTLLGNDTLTVESIVAIPLECGDVAYNKVTYEEFQSSLNAGLAHDETGIGMTLTWTLQLACSGWPFPEAPETNELNLHKMLLVTADFDATAPTEWTSYIWEEQARKSALVVRHGDGHVSFQRELFRPRLDVARQSLNPFLVPNQPSSLITKEFLRTGVLPKPRNETLVSVYSPGMHRALIPDPYQVQTGVAAGDVESK
ncbi:hypothetical protein F5Y06DRAFT_114052 [Hypoxylon sp. FL0890]|nr:hypothetical protein F5Y06DRAFT_114052 [Hypoxylon sp. FL0890]